MKLYLRFVCRVSPTGVTADVSTLGRGFPNREASGMFEVTTGERLAVLCMTEDPVLESHNGTGDRPHADECEETSSGIVREERRSAVPCPAE